MVGILAYAECVAKVMEVTSTPKPPHKSRCLNSHPFVDDIVIEYKDVERGFEEGEGMEEDMPQCFNVNFYIERL